MKFEKWYSMVTFMWPWQMQYWPDWIYHSWDLYTYKYNTVVGRQHGFRLFGFSFDWIDKRI